jgi:multisubunit Na+/H+ antiporter MnhC subunit
MSNLFSTIAELLGATAIVIGCAMFSIPLSLIVAGVLTILASYVVNNR